MTKKELDQLYHLKKEIELLRDQIYSLDPKMTTDSVKGSCADFPYTLHRITITGIDMKGYNMKLKRLSRKLQLRVDELMNLVEKMNEYIEDVEDSEMRQILSLRYVKGLTWQQVAIHMGNEGDGSTERKKHDRFLKVSRISLK